MNFSRRVLFTLFPVGYWVVIVVGIVFHLIPETSQFGNILINLGAFLVAFKAAVIIHEAGHLIAARAVGGTPRRVVFGKGHELYRTKISNIRVVINSNFIGGHAYATFDQQKFLKLRYMVFIIGGVLLNVVCALVMYAFFNMGFTNSNGDVLVAIPFTIFLANAPMILNLIPYDTTIAGMKVPTDGLALLKLPFSKTAEIEKRLDINLLFDGHEFLEKKDYQSAWKVFNEYLRRYPDVKILSMNRSLILLKTGETEKSLEECLKLLNHLEDRDIKPYAGLIYNQLAWTYLVLNDIAKADHFSALAISAVRNENLVRGTRGSVLIEKGSINEGINLLFHSMDFEFVNNATLSSAIYLMLAYSMKGNLKESDKYFQFVKRNEDRLEADERTLFERNLIKMQQKVIK